MKWTYLLIIFLCACTYNAKVEKKSSDLIINIPKPPPKHLGSYLNPEYIKLLVDSFENNIMPIKSFAVFDTLKYNKVIAFDFDGSEESHSEILKKLKFYDSQITQFKPLSQIQIEKIINLLSLSSSYGDVTAACFNPHFGMVFYNNNKPVFQINICLECNYLESTNTIPASTSHKRMLDKNIEITDNGFSKNCRKNIDLLLQQLNFSHRLNH
jgi:hypothetical protein